MTGETGTPLTWDDLANEYDAANKGSRPARTLPMNFVFSWAENQPDKFFVGNDGVLNKRNKTAEMVFRFDEETLTPVWDETHVMTFGKYKGKTLGEIILLQPSYLLWLHDEAIATFPPELYDEAIWQDAENMEPESWYLDDLGSK